MINIQNSNCVHVKVCSSYVETRNDYTKQNDVYLKQTNSPTFIKGVKDRCYINFSINSRKYCNVGVFLENYNNSFPKTLLNITEVNYYR